MEMCLTGATFSAQQAEQWGLVSKVLPADEVLAQLAAQNSLAIAHSRQVYVARVQEWDRWEARWLDTENPGA